MSEHELELGQDRVRRRESDERADVAEATPDLRWASTIGNRAVQKLAQAARMRRAGGVGAGPLDETVTREIESRRGGGRTLDSDARTDLEQRMGQDFSDVRVHTDSGADALNRAVQAEAFTTGSDVFFRDGNYRPESSDGRELLAHELTHVVQQRGAPSTSQLEVTDPGDATETEAHDIAKQVSTGAPATVSRAPTPEEEAAMAPGSSSSPAPSPTATAPPEEEVATLPVQRAPTPEEEAASAPGSSSSPAPSPTATAPPEEEVATLRVQREPETDEAEAVD